MKFSEYRKHCMRTAGDIRPEVVALGLCGEAGEVADFIKKHIGHGHPLDRDRLIEELGDLLWYWAVDRDRGKDFEFSLEAKCEGTPCRLALYICECAVDVDRTRHLPYVISGLASHVGATLDEVAERNVAKLQRRYPDGFSVERSMNRGES